MLYDKRWDKQLVKTIERSPERQALLELADYFEVNGWCQAFWGLGGAVCAITALNKLGYEGHTPVGNAARRLFFARNGRTMMEWNDAPGRTKQEVIAALRATALE